MNLVALLVAADGQEAALQRAVDRVNARLSPVERVRRFAPVPAFSVEDGTLTPTMKVRRRIVLDRNAALLESLQNGR